MVTDKILIVDALNVFINSFVRNPSMDANGGHVGGSQGFLLSLNKLIRENRPTEVLIVWDGEGGNARRRSLFKDYKSGRKPKLNRQYDFEDVDAQKISMRRQIMFLEKYLSLLPVTAMCVDGCEADDVIAFIARFERDQYDKVIVSTDRDYWQLIDERTIVYSPVKKEYFAAKQLRDHLNVVPENYIFVKSFCGDTSDNIKGIKGIGPKTILKLFPFLAERPVMMSDLIEHAEKNIGSGALYERVLDNRELITRNYKLMQLSHPEMTTSAIASVRHALTKEPVYRPIEMRMALVDDGLQVTAGDFFSNFREQYHRTINSMRSRDSK